MAEPFDSQEQIATLEREAEIRARVNNALCEALRMIMREPEKAKGVATSILYDIDQLPEQFQTPAERELAEAKIRIGKLEGAHILIANSRNRNRKWLLELRELARAVVGKPYMMPSSSDPDSEPIYIVERLPFLALAAALEEQTDGTQDDGGLEGDQAGAASVSADAVPAVRDGQAPATAPPQPGPTR